MILKSTKIVLNNKFLQIVSFAEFKCMKDTRSTRKLKRFLLKSKGCRVVKSTTGQQCKLTRNKHGMVTRLTC